jgi:hypothetical protein
MIRYSTAQGLNWLAESGTRRTVTRPKVSSTAR